MTDLLDDASLPNDVDGLTAEIAEAQKRIAACGDKIEELLRAERPAEGLFHAAEIHRLKQLRMMLRYQVDLRTARANRLRQDSGAQ